MDETVPRARWTRHQPWRGLFGFAVTCALSLVITTNSGIDSYLGLLSLWIMSLVPLELVMTIGWQNRYPPVGSLAQPWCGLLRTAIMFLIGTAVCFAVLRFIGGGAAHPLTIVFAICCVVLTVVATASFGLWPFARLSLPAKGFLTLIAVYVVVHFGIQLFDFSLLSYPEGVNPPSGPAAPFFAAGGPLAAFEHLAPKGPIPWESALTVWLWVAFLTFTCVVLEFWPFSKFPGIMKQPAMGIAVFVSTFAGAWIVYRIGVGLMHMEPLRLMYAGVSYAFGLLLILVLFQRWPGKLLPGPAGAWLNVAAAVVIAYLGYHGVISICRWHFGELPYPMNVFAPATFMLGLNFPLWVAYADLWEFWPLPPAEA